MLVDACECLPVTPREEGSGLIYFDLATSTSLYFADAR